MPKFRPLKKEDISELSDLLTQLSSKKIELTDKHVSLLIEDANHHPIAIEFEGKLVGFGLLVIYVTTMNGHVGIIEDIIVDESQRGKGLGKKLLQNLIEIAKKQNANRISLTSNPQRVIARKLYQSLGFEPKDTGVFILRLK